jgi:hypothetical protein
VSKALLDSRTADRLAKIDASFDSEHPGDRASAQAGSFIRRIGLAWHGVISGLSEGQRYPTALQPDWCRIAHQFEANRFNARDARVIVRKQRADQKAAAELAAVLDAYVVGLGIAR